MAASPENTINFVVESAGPVKIGPHPFDFVNPGNVLRLVQVGDFFTLEVTRGTFTTQYPGFRWKPTQKIWFLNDLKFEDAFWYTELKLADFTQVGTFIYAILIPNPGDANDDPDATGGYTARGQAGRSRSGTSAKPKAAGARKAK